MVGARRREELARQYQVGEREEREREGHARLDADPTPPEREGQRGDHQDKTSDVKGPAVVVEDAEEKVELAPGRSEADRARPRARTAEHQNRQGRNER